MNSSKIKVVLCIASRFGNKHGVMDKQVYYYIPHFLKINERDYLLSQHIKNGKQTLCILFVNTH